MATSNLTQAMTARLLLGHPRASAPLLEERPPDDVAALLAAQPAAVAARVLERMVPAQAAEVVARLEPEASRSVVPRIAASRAASLLSWLADDERERLLSTLERGDARELSDLMGYPSGSAGSLMDPRFTEARETDTVARAVASLGRTRAPLHQLLVVDDKGRLVGAVPVQALAVADRDAPVGPMIDREVGALDAFTPREEVVEYIGRTGLPSIPVVDRERRVVGVLRHSALVGAAAEEAAANMQQMVGAGRDESALSPAGYSARKRLPWLNINLLTAFLAAAVVGMFESTIARVTSLAVLLPVVAGQSGNSGSQALAVTMRGLALHEIRSSHWPRVLLKELKVGIINGLSIAVVTGIGVAVWSGSAMLAAIIAVSMVLSMVAAGMAGASIPILLKRLGQDPAQSSSIILTTVTDVVGFSSFLGLATLLVSHL